MKIQERYSKGNFRGCILKWPSRFKWVSHAFGNDYDTREQIN
jgi:hypothetical protein